MKNLLVQDLFTLIKKQIDASQFRAEAKELRIFLTSFPSHILRRVFELVEDYVLKQQPDAQLIIKASKPSSTAWRKEGREQDFEFFTHKDWIDSEDEGLTHYRNLKCDENHDRLITLLSGVDMVLDVGGLADFLVISEDTVWSQSMESSFEGWVRMTFNEIGLDDFDLQARHASNLFFGLIYDDRPRDLVFLSEFLAELITKRDQFGGGNANEVLRYLYRSLPKWGIPPLIETSPSKSSSLLPKAMKFINYSGFAESSARKKSIMRLRKLQESVAEKSIDFALPETVKVPEKIKIEEFSSSEAYLDSVLTFVQTNSTAERLRLTYTDAAPILHFLNQKIVPPTGERPSKNTVITLRGPSQVAFLQAIWKTVSGKLDNSVWEETVAQLTAITIELREFKHNVSDSLGDGDEDGFDARELLRGLLGGLEEYLHFEIPNPSGAPDIQIALNGDWSEYGINYTRLKSGTPHLIFDVELHLQDGSRDFQTFRWLCPDVHEERTSFNFAKVVGRELKKLEFPNLPVFQLPTYAELFFAATLDEVNRLMLLGLGQGLDLRPALPESVLTIVRDQHPEIYQILRDCRSSYSRFIETYVTRGFYFALKHDGDRLIENFVQLLETIAQAGVIADSDIGYGITKSFLIVSDRLDVVQKHTPSAVAFGLSISVLEICYARATYLQVAFGTLLTQLLSGQNRDVGMAEFEQLVSLVEIKRPIVALLKDVNKNITTACNSFGLVHLLGERPMEVLTLSSLSMLEEDDLDEELGVMEMFAETPQAKALARVLNDYVTCFPHAADGLSLLVIDCDDIQAVIAAANMFLKNVTANRSTNSPSFKFSLELLSRSSNAFNIQRWLSSWQLLWDPRFGQARYSNCLVSVRFRHFSRTKEYESVLSSNDFDDKDIALLTNFIGPKDGGDEFQSCPKFQFDADLESYLKFPMGEFPRPVTEGLSDRWRRYTVVSNRRMRVATNHAELLARVKLPNLGDDQHVVITPVDFEPWINLVDLLHRKSNWVCCLDAHVDKFLITDKRDDSRIQKREVVGLATGLGAHGELNLTLSTETSSLADLRTALSKRMRNLFSSWSKDDADTAALGILSVADQVAGLSLVKAVGNSDYIRDFVAYSIVRKNLQVDDTSVCDILLPLDSYRHWLADDTGIPWTENRGQYPDLLHLRVSLTGAEFFIDAGVIECKLAEVSNVHIEKAKTQVKNGVVRLARTFLPRGLSEEGDRHNRRYWWGQLQRVIAAHMRLPIRQKNVALSALERLAEGRYDIRWTARVATFWTDMESSKAKPEIIDSLRNFSGALQFEESNSNVLLNLEIYHIAFGFNQVRDLCVQSLQQLPSVAGIELPYVRPAAEVEPHKDSASPFHNESSSEDLERALVIQTPNSTATFMLEQRKETVDRGTMIGGNVALETSSPSSISSPDASDGLPPPVVSPIPTASKGVPDRILLGLAGEREVFWEFGHAQLPNRHFLILGRSGTGKTYAIQALLMELAARGQNSLIIDYTDGFLPKRLEENFRDEVNPQSYVARSEPLPINPFRFQKAVLEDLGGQVVEDDPGDVAQRVVDVFDTGYNLGLQQRNALTQSIIEGITSSPNSFNMDDMLNILQNSELPGADTLAAKLSPFARRSYFGQESGMFWDDIFTDTKSSCHIVQLTHIPNDASRVLAEFILWDLFYYSRTNGSPRNPRPIVLDEVQNLSHHLESPLGKMLTEGRKFGLSLILATQTLSGLKKDEQNRLFQASHKLFFAPAETELKEYAQLLADNTNDIPLNEWKSRLRTLKKGEAWSLGPSLNGLELRTHPIKVKISALESRTKV